MLTVFSNAWKERVLIRRLVNREIQARYRGSALGIVWAALLPLATIAIYAFVFGTVFRARWSVPEHAAANSSSEYSFGIMLFVGFIIFGIFSEPINRAPGLMLENPSYIKKVVFPLDVLAWVSVLAALVSAGIAFTVFLVIFTVMYGLPSIMILLLPLIVLPIVFIALGFTYILSSLGVYIRDIRQFIPLLTTMMMFLSPVLYPIENVPERFRQLVLINPLTIGITQARDAIFWGKLPNILEWSAYLLVSVTILVAGHAWFARTKKGFADVL